MTETCFCGSNITHQFGCPFNKFNHNVGIQLKPIEKLELIYDIEIGAYRIPQIVDRSKFQVLNAYCEIIKR
jgi:hypothetical protein